jgi:hypothetical protein
MGLRYVSRRWLAPGGWDGPRFSADQTNRFERLMRKHASTLGASGWKKPVKGKPSLVSSWDDGSSALCWYTARCGSEEKALLRECVEIFEAEPIPNTHPGE